MKRTLISAILLAGTIAFGGPAEAQEGEPRSYTTQYELNRAKYRAIMFPHEIDGCKMMLQSIRDMNGVFVERTGPDCNCDLVIDNQEHIFEAATGYGAGKLLAVCEGPGVPGNTRKAEIMRESLKEVPDFSKMQNVAPLDRREDLIRPVQRY